MAAALHVPLLDRSGGTAPGQAGSVVLELDLARGVLGGRPSSLADGLARRHAPTLRAIREGLGRAATDHAVIGLIVHAPVGPTMDLAVADEIAAAIGEFSQAKPSVAWSESFGEMGSGLVGYRVALAAGRIWLQPSGSLGLVGVHLGITLYRGGLEKLGIEPQFGQRKEYKSAADRFAAHEVTAANREMTQRLADAIAEDTIARVSERRQLTADAIRALMARAPLTAEDALAAGLIDGIGYRDEIYDWARSSWPSPVDEPPTEPRFTLQYVHRYARTASRTLSRLADRGRPQIRVVSVAGPIVTGPGRVGLNGPVAGSDTIAAQLRAAGRDKATRAVVLRVDSPGGSYIASDTIRREVVRLVRGGIPVVASMGSVAASGGYFVSMAGSEIVANPTTLTGSIGVLAGKLVLRGLRDRLGIVHESVAADPRAGMMSGDEPFTGDQRQALEDWLDRVYADFTGKAAADRALPLETLEPLARGRVWLGVDAARNGLVDRLGGMAVAVRRAAVLAGVDPDRVRLHGEGPLAAVLRQIRPAESSEAESGTVAAAGGPVGELIGLATGRLGPDELLSRAAEVVGLPVPYGVLSLPFRLRFV